MTRYGWKKLGLGMLLSLLAVIMGCTGTRDLALVTENRKDPVAQRFNAGNDEGARTVIDSAVQLSDKYAQLTARAADMRQTNQQLS